MRQTQAGQTKAAAGESRPVEMGFSVDIEQKGQESRVRFSLSSHRGGAPGAMSRCRRVAWIYAATPQPKLHRGTKVCLDT